MSASSTWLPPRAPRLRRVSSACVALRRGRKPYEHGRKSASKIGSSTSFAAICTTRSRTVGMPSGRCFPSAFGMYRRSTACGRYLPARSVGLRAPPGSAPRRAARSPRASRHRRPRRPCSASPASTPPRRTSLLQMRSYSAWKRRPGDRLAAAHSRRWSCRTLSTGLRPPGWLDRVVAGHALALTSSRDATTAGALPSGRVVLSRPSSVLRPPRTPAAQRSISPSAYTSRLAVTTAAQTGLSCSAPLLERVLLPVPRRDPPRAPDSRASDVAFAVT